MAYVDSSGKTHVSLSEASRGYAAQTTASRNAAGQIVGSSSGSNYARAQEAAEAENQSKYSSMVEYNTTPAWMTSPGETAGIDRSQLQQFRTVDQIKREKTASDLKAWAGDSKFKKAIAGAYAATYDIDALKDTIKTTDKKASTSLGLPELSTIAEKRDEKLQKIGLLETQRKQQEYVQNQKYLSGLLSFTESEYNSLREKPVSTVGEMGLLYGAGAAGGAVIGGGSLLARSGLTKIGFSRAASLVEPAVNTALGYSVLKEASDIKSVEEGLYFGKNLAFIGAGYGTGKNAGVKGYDTLRTLGSKEISIESVIKPSVLSGKEQFPLTEKGANALDVIGSYKDPLTGSYTGYHATTGSMGKNPQILGNVNRPTDVPGLYVSPLNAGASPHFLRLSGEGRSPASVIFDGVKTADLGKIKQGIFGISEPLSPNIMKISITDVGRLPEAARYNPTRAQEFLLSDTAPKGSAFLTPVLESTVKAGGRAEAEAIIVPKTNLLETSSSNYFEYKGRKIQLKEYKTLETEKALSPKINGGPKEIAAQDLLTTSRYEPPGSKGLISYIALPIRFSSSLVDPLRSANSVVDPIRSSSYEVDPLRSISSVVDPLRSTSYVVDPIKSSSYEVDPLRSTSSIVDPIKSSSYEVDPLRSTSSIVDPIKSSSYEVDPLRSTSSVVDPLRSTSLVVDPLRYTPETGNSPDLGSNPDPFRYELIPHKKNKPTEDINLEIEPLEQPKSIRKTKKKMLRNTYGDPLKIKLKL